MVKLETKKYRKRDSITGFLQLMLQKPFCRTHAEAYLEPSQTSISWSLFAKLVNH